MQSVNVFYGKWVKDRVSWVVMDSARPMKNKLALSHGTHGIKYFFIYCIFSSENNKMHFCQILPISSLTSTSSPKFQQ